MMLFSLSFVSCDFFADGDLDNSSSGNKPTPVQITSLKLEKSKLNLKVGSLEYINIEYKPSNAEFKPSFSYDKTKIEVTSKDNGVVVKGLEEGQTELTVSCNNRSATCIITVTGFEAGYEKTVEPYIYSNTNILQLSPGLSEKVFVSLYGGSVADINNYTWSVEDNTVCKVDPTGQYGLIKAIAPGYTRIKISHTKAAYPYYMGVYVFDDPTKATYITTSNNIVTMNQDDGEQTLNVSLVNSLETSRESDFNWEIINDNTSDIPINFSYNGNKAVVTPKKSGVCTLRVTHPDAVYPLDILCRVITIVKNVYIEPDTSIITLSGNKEEKVISKLVNLNQGDYSLNDYQYQIINPEVAEITAAIGETVYLKGKKNGSTKLIISHSKSAYTREVLLISTNQITDAIDASCFITTTNNYVRTKVGNSPTELNVSLKGGEEGDEKDFSWTVENYPADDSTDNVVSLETPTGNVFLSRMAQYTYSFGNAYITPLKEGTAIIKVTHPKVLYPLEILVKVLSKDAILEEPMFFKGEGLVRVLNGETYDYTVYLNGSSKKDSDNTAIRWTIDDNRLSINGNENTCEIKAPSMGTGSTISHLSISHPKVDVSKSVLVLTADNEETLNSMKALYTDKNYYNLEIGKTVGIFCETVGFDSIDEETGETNPYDYSLLTWTMDKTGIVDYSFADNTDKRYIKVTAINSGTVKLKASLEGYECIYTITVYPIGAVQTEPEMYFTTNQNVIIFNELNTSKTASITAINMPANMYSDITWSCNNDICSVIPNGTSATIIAAKEGEAIISIDHPQSQNTLKIYVKVGSEYIVQETQVVYISSQDVITMLRDEQPQKLQAVLVNYNGADGEHFTFSIDDTSVAKISAQSQSGIAYISPVGSGQAEVTITNPVSQINKKVLIVVGNSAEELAGIQYLTTTNNVVSIGEGKNKTVSVSVKNAEDIILDGYSWTSSDYNIADVISNGSTASIKANSIGTAIITVTNTVCRYPLQIIVHVVDPIAASAHPYIQLTSSVVVLTVDNTYSSLSADLIGGTDDDKAMFNWSSNDSSVCMCYGQNEVGKLKAVAEGTTYVTVSHPKADYSAQLLVICEKKTQSECYISVPSSIVNMKPTDEATSITATLINGNANDKYNFNWSLDVYDIIDFQYSANVCTIKPKQAGTATITISHPKADYDQQIIVNVQEYTTFAFPSTNITITQGEVKFLNMQVPNTSVKTHIEYFVKNESICSIAGTKQVAQITGINKGSTTVTAKLVATNTGAEQASSDLMIYVKERATTDAYITSKSTIYTLQKGKSQTLTASITGTDILVSDQANLKWSTSDSDVIGLTGLNTNGYVKGQSVYITAKKAGEAIITCSHDKASSVLEFYVFVPGSEKKIVSLSKTYITIVKGSSGVSLNANIENAESNDDYNNLEWSCIGANGIDGSSIARIMGSGKNVQIYPVSPGEVTVYAQLPDSDSIGKCTVVVQAGKSLTVENSGCKVMPYETKEISYKVSPNNAIISWLRNSDDDYFEYKDLGYDSEGNGKLQVTGIKEGQGLLMGTTDGGAAVKLTIKCAWSYNFSIKGSTSFNIPPTQSISFEYTVSPANADISVESPDLNTVFKANVTKKGEVEANPSDLLSSSKSSYGIIEIIPLQETDKLVSIRLIAKNKANDAIIGEQKLSGYIKYNKLEVEVNNSARIIGKYSELKDNILNLGDGETYTIRIGIKNEKANGYIEDIIFKPNTEGVKLSDKITSYTTSVGETMELSIEHKDDVIKREEKYKIKKLLVDKRYPSLDDLKKFTWSEWYTDSGRWTLFSLRFPCPDGYGRGDCPIYYLWGDNTNSYLNWRYIGRSYKYGGDSNYLKYGYDENRPATIASAYWSAASQSNPNLVEREDMRDYVMSKTEFESIPWLYCPGTKTNWANEDVYFNNIEFFENGWENGWYKDGDQGTYIQAHIMTQHVTAESFIETSSDSTPKDSKNIGVLVITLNHNGKTEKADFQIPVYLKTRDCPCQ